MSDQFGGKRTMRGHGGGGDVVYGLGLIGALVYYLQHAHGLLPVLVGIVKALVWPAFVVYHLLRHMAV